MQVDDSKFPYSTIGKVLTEDTICTGTVIDPYTIITAAHCVAMNAGNGRIQWKKTIRFIQSGELGFTINRLGVRV